MQKSFKNILKGTCRIFESMTDILTFGAYQQPITDRSRANVKMPSLKQTHGNLITDMDELAKDLRCVTGYHETTCASLTILQGTKFLINHRPAALDYRTHILKERQRH